jgi:Lipoprotein LpqB beta-propeller domain/Sporulation and spore germination
MASPRSLRIWLPAALAATAATVLAGCATVPSGGAPQLVTTGGSQVQAYEELLQPPGPRAYLKPDQVVLGFLHASASYAVDSWAAKQFLVPALRAKWHPGPVTVVSSISKTPPPNPRLGQTGAPGKATVEFKGQQLATLSRAGQYQYSLGTATYHFSLLQVDNEWLISELPHADQESLLLTQWDFEHVYQARNLFFFARSPSPVNGKLIPDPVYAPLQSSDSALNTNLASGLVNGLLKDQHSWLSSVTKTSFPHGTTLLGVTIIGQTAVVNLGGAAVHATATQQRDMAEQLRATLGSTVYSASLARVIVLEINGRRAYTKILPQLIYPVPTGPLVYRNGEYIVSRVDKSARQIAGPVPFNPADITALAVAPKDYPRGGQLAVAAKDGGGCRVYLPPIGAGSGQPTVSGTSHLLSTSGGECTSLSWDSNGNLWAAEGRHIWVLRASDGRWQLVGAPANLTTGRQPEILALRMAPDAVRVALLIKTGAKAEASLVLAAVHEAQNQLSLGTPVDVGTGLPDPIAMSWYSPYDLVVLDDSGISEVPLTGGAGQQIGPAPPGAVSLTTDGTTLAVGTDNEIWTSPTLGAPWSAHQTGSLPIYPG